MPLYEYECREHGVFELVRPMAESRLGAPCPRCGLLSARILSTPARLCLPRATRVAHERNERSRHEPKLVQREAVSSSPVQSPPLRHGGGRPWALEHG